MNTPEYPTPDKFGPVAAVYDAMGDWQPASSATEAPSTIVQENITALIERERAGRIEHGGDLDRQDLPVTRWLEELRCESLDSANYATKLMHLLPKLLAAVAELERMGRTWADGEWKPAAAPGIDLADISRLLVKKMAQASAANHDNASEYSKGAASAMRVFCDELGALIDASPKGGSPSNCRNRLIVEGKPYPRSGCAHCKTGGMTGCPYEKAVHMQAPNAEVWS